MTKRETVHLEIEYFQLNNSTNSKIFSVKSNSTNIYRNLMCDLEEEKNIYLFHLEETDFELQQWSYELSTQTNLF